MTGLQAPQPGEFLLYETEDGRTRVECRFVADTLWLPQGGMAELFQTSKQNVAKHLKSIFAEGELDPASVVNHWLTTASGRSSPSAKIAFRCLATFCLLVWNSSAMPACGSHSVSATKRHSTRVRPSSVS